MDFAARLSPPLLSHLRVVTGRDHTVVAAEQWSDLLDVVHTHAIDVVVADPRADGAVRLNELCALAERFPSLPIVIYTVLAADTLGAVVELAKLGVRHVVLRNFDDEPRRFRELLERQPAYAMSDAMLASLAVPLARVPPELARAIERLFRAPHSFAAVGDLATAAGMTRRSVDRWLERSGMASGRMVVLVARLLRAYFYMRDRGRSLDEITAQLGYGSARLFARQVRAATGLTPTELRQEMEPDRFLALLAERLSRRGDEANVV